MKPFRLLRRVATWSSLGLAGGAMIVTTRHLLATPQPLDSALPGEGRLDRRPEGDIYYNLAGPADADALVLLHDFYPGASNFEYRRVFARLAETHHVYAPDWLGFGMSERPALAYTGEFYAHLLREFLRGTVGRPAAVLAHGLAGNVAVRAASDEPALFSRLVLVTPRTHAGTREAPTLGQTVIRGAQRSSMGLVPYATLTTRSALRWQLRRRAARPGEGAATDDAVDHLYASAHQFGGQFAPLAQLTGELDLPLQNALALLEPPVLVVAGERDTVQSRAQLEDLVLLNPHAQLLTIADAGDAIYEDAPDTFVNRVTFWLSSARERHAPRLSDAMRAGPGAPLPPRDRPTPAVVATAAATGATLRGGILSPEADEEDMAQPANTTDDASAATNTAATGDDALSPAERDEYFVPLDVADNAAQETKPGEPRFDPTSPTPAMTGTRGDVRADAAPPNLERELEAPNASASGTTSDAADAADAPAGDTLRASMSAPEAPVPTTIAAITAPLDESAPRPEEGADHPLTGPHPVPADAREDEETTRADAADATTADAAITDARITTPEAAAIVHNEQASAKRTDEVAQTRQTADLLAATEAQVAEEAARLDERIQAAGPPSAQGETEAGAETTTEAELPTPAAVTEEPRAQPSSPTHTGGETEQRGATKPGAAASRAASPRTSSTGRAPQRADTGEARQAPGRSGTRPASSKSANKGSGAHDQPPGQSANQPGSTKRHTSRKGKHSHH